MNKPAQSLRRAGSLFFCLLGLIYTISTQTSSARPLRPLPNARAGSLTVAALTRDLHRIKTFEAKFTEHVSNSALKSHANHIGRVWIERPNRFRWLYVAPHREIITADGRALWIYDVTLEQVTVRPMAPSLGATPAMLLAGSRPLISLFKITIKPMDQGRQWALLEPRAPHSEFRKIDIELRKGVPEGMILWDRLGEKTEIRFSAIRINHPINPQRFRFAPPKGVAVIGHP